MKKYGYKIQAIAVIGCVGLSLILSRCSPLAPSGFKGIGSHGNSGLPGQQNNLNFVSIYQLDVSVLGNEVFDKTVATMPASQKAVELSQTLSPTQFQELQNTGHTDVQFATPPPKG
ncbi:MAG: hypothetical protein ACXWP5_05560, partial [Bdellovibrionota bacterium]